MPDESTTGACRVASLPWPRPGLRAREPHANKRWNRSTKCSSRRYAAPPRAHVRRVGPPAGAVQVHTRFGFVGCSRAHFHVSKSARAPLPAPARASRAGGYGGERAAGGGRRASAWQLKSCSVRPAAAATASPRGAGCPGAARRSSRRGAALARLAGGRGARQRVHFTSYSASLFRRRAAGDASARAGQPGGEHVHPPCDRCQARAPGARMAPRNGVH